ncbi:DUF1275 domain-containing protein [Herbiconiux sp. CPCC 205716]|uniref:DUF1275 domain-containing protein n=1 Tax=Herbiconiux gentiana TaxID=2970912 RepID=A0ABT2GA20_9MICO|nr:YoaK family protein [Herbiconiux gentiana]MCS5713039.1 DUF1275 domain-containing protein [Herbiconiux gentiana]
MTTAPSARLHLALVMLSFAAGAADAFAFLALSGTFTANMTGNLVLAAMFTRPGWLRTALCALVAVASFAVVLYLGFRHSRGQVLAGDHRRLVRRLLVPSSAAQGVVVVVWLATGAAPDVAVQCAVIALSAGALALQTVAAKRLSDIDGITTTYVTGSLTTTMQDLAERHDAGQLFRLLSIAAVPAGAVVATAVLHLALGAGPLVAFVVATAAALVALPRIRRTT